MTKKEFLDELSKELENLNKEERNSAIKYYEDYFDDAGEENENDVIKELGTPKKVAESIKKEYSENNTQTSTKETTNKKEPLPIWALILIGVFLIPVGIPLIMAFFGTVFGLFMGLIGIFFGLIGAGVGLFVSGIATITLAIITAVTSPVSGLLLGGVGLVLLSLGMIFTFLSIKLCAVVIPPIIRGMVELCKLPFRKRGA